MDARTSRSARRHPPALRAFLRARGSKLTGAARRRPLLRRYWQHILLLAVAGGAGLVLYGSWTRPGPGPSSVVNVPLPPGGGLTQPLALPPPNLLRPLSPEEAVKQNAERPFVKRPDSPAAGFVLKADADNRARALECLTQAVYYEAAGEGSDGGRAVAQVVLNRLHHPGYPSSVCGVIYEGSDRSTGCQFSFTCNGALRQVPVPWLWARSRQIAEDALAGRVFAPVGHATHYHAAYVLPYWADSLDKTIQIGQHIFYRLRSSLGDKAAFSQRYGGAEPVVKPPVQDEPAPEELTQQLASALISDQVQGASTDIEKASPAPASPLLVDSTAGTLLADGGATPVIAHKAEPKPRPECGSSSESNRLTPLGANDVRTTANKGC